MRLIDADYVIEKLTKWEQSTKTKRYVTVSQIKYMFDIIPTIIENSDIEGEIAKQPVADVAKVVRCKDCEHYDKEYHKCKLHSEEPDQYYTGFIFCMQEDDFCSYGERIVSKKQNKTRILFKRR